jgi:hypothetical protein
MNRTIKAATVNRQHHDDHEPLRAQLETFVHTDTFANRLKLRQGRTAFEVIAEAWPCQSQRLSRKPDHHAPGLKRWRLFRSFEIVACCHARR